MRTSLRFAIALLLTSGTALAAPKTATAQNPVPLMDNGSRFEVRPFIGAFVPTGARRDLLKAAPTVGAQLAASVNKNFSMVGTFSYSGNEGRNLVHDVNVYQYDLGAEIGFPIPLSTRTGIKPFFGAGAGGRSYDYRGIRSDAQHNFAGYVATGAQMQVGRLGFRTEVRDYVSSFRGLSGERASRDASNDLSFTTGVSIRF